MEWIREDVEHRLLGSVMFDLEKWEQRLLNSGLMVDETFFNKECKDIYKFICDNSDIVDIEPLMVKASTINKKMYEFMMNIYLSECTSVALEHYASLVIDKKLKSKIKEAYKSGIQAIETNTDAVIDVIENVNNEVSIIDTYKQRSARAYTIDKIIKNFKESNHEENNVKFGYKHIDSAIDFYKGQVMVVAGRSGTGKTALAIQLLANISKNKEDVLLFSLEMNANDIYKRLVNNHLISDIVSADPYETIDEIKNRISSTVNKDILREVYHGGRMQEELSKRYKHLIVVDKENMSLQEIEQMIIQTKRTHKTISTIAIDYLGYIKKSRGMSNYEAVSEIAREVKNLAKRQNIRIILLCQTSRAGEDGTMPVKLHHLRDSGAIEESADFILGLWQSPERDEIVCTEILKNRSGQKGIRIDFARFHTYFYELHDIHKDRIKEEEEVELNII